MHDHVLHTYDESKIVFDTDGWLPYLVLWLVIQTWTHHADCVFACYQAQAEVNLNYQQDPSQRDRIYATLLDNTVSSGFMCGMFTADDLHDS